MVTSYSSIALYLEHREEICIWPSVVKPVVINCNEDNLLRDLMLHKLSMINFIKFLSVPHVWGDGIPRWHFVTLQPSEIDKIIQININVWSRKTTRKTKEVYNMFAFKISYVLLNKTLWDFIKVCPALSSGCRPLQVGTSVVSTLCHYNIHITLHYITQHYKPANI